MGLQVQKKQYRFLQTPGCSVCVCYAHVEPRRVQHPHVLRVVAVARSLLRPLPSISVCRRQIHFLQTLCCFFLGDLCSKAFSYSPLSPGLNPEPFGNRRVTCVAAFSPPTLQEVEGYAATREWERPGPERWAGSVRSLTGAQTDFTLSVLVPCFFFYCFNVATRKFRLNICSLR